MPHLLTAEPMFSLCCSQASLSSWIFCLFFFWCCLAALSFLTSSLSSISCCVIHPLLLAILPPRLLTAEGMSRHCCSLSSLYVMIPTSVAISVHCSLFSLSCSHLSFHNSTIFMCMLYYKKIPFWFTFVSYQYVPIGDGWSEVLVRNVSYYVPVLHYVPITPQKSPSNAPPNAVALLKTIMYRAIKTTGTLIVIIKQMTGNFFKPDTHFDSVLMPKSTC
jgi:hypothetical protein